MGSTNWVINLNNCTCLYYVYSGPEGTPFEGGVFTARLSFPMDYPLNPPKMKFISDIFHPNSNNFLVTIIIC